MAIKCILHDHEPDDAKPGDMWFAPYLDDVDLLSPEYERDWRGKRLPLVVAFPNGMDFCVDFRAIKDGVPKPNGWTVTGQPPNITVRPSININEGRSGAWHGWLRNGELIPA